MSIADNLKRAFVAAPQELPSSQDLERSTRRRVFFAFAGFVFVLTAGYAVLFWRRGEPIFALENGSASLFALACVLVARRTGAYAWPLRTLSLFVLGWLCYLTLLQGPGLPSAGWWLSIIPFILAGAGLYYLAIGTVLAFIGVVTVLYVGPASLPFNLPHEVAVEPWRRYVAIVGSELLALCLIIVAMRSRAQLASVLEMARAAASEAAALKARFLANMSHEIRTPLTGIIGAAEVLDSANLSEAQRLQLLALQRHSARTLLALVNDVLDFAKLDAGKVALENQPVFLRAIVFEANELFSMQAFGKGIELSSSCNPDVPQAFVGDPVRLRQIVSNLVSNAVKFTSRGGVHIHLSIDALDERRDAGMDGRRWVRVEVVDSGPGIADAQLPTLFNAFVQADLSVTRRFGGTGLGLSISQELSRLMGGRLEVRSVVGQGSSFSLVVPLPVGSDELPLSLPSRRDDVVLCTANRGLERHLKSLLHELKVDPLTTGALPTPPELAHCNLLIVDAPLLQLPDAGPWLAGQAGAGRRVAVLTPLGGDAVVGLPADALLVYKPVRKKALEAILMTCGIWAGDKAAEPHEAKRPLAAMHVLVAEDNAVNQVVVQAMLSELGVTSAVAGNGQEALDYLAGEPFDIVLMDVQMPVMDGLSATRALRAREAQERSRRVTVLAMTATSESEDGQACLDAGMDGYLTKPFGLARLRRCLETVAGERAGPTGLGSHRP